MNISQAPTPPAGRKPPAGEACAVEKLPHLTTKLCLLWEYPEFDSFCSHLLMDSRDGTRQGLPWEVAEEILFLADFRVTKRALIASEVTGRPFWEIYQKMIANAEAGQQKAQHVAWNDPLSNTNLSRSKGDRSAPPHNTRGPDQGPPRKKRSWLTRLMG
ncbi:MAG: hypothetical protein WBO23_16330 [Burkholderiales bacterium]